MGNTSIAIILARSGSKGVKDKNILPLNGIPLLVYSIRAAMGSGVFSEIFVSTDSAKYAEIACEYGASVPFLRSSEISGDKASSWDAVLEALTKYEKLNKKFDSVCLLQPTSPLREASDIVESYKILNNKNANSVIGVCEVEHSPLWCNTLDNDCSLNEFIPQKTAEMPRQSLPKFYRINGAIYWVKTEYLKTSQNFYNNTSYAYIMPQNRSIDIDTKVDFAIAEAIMNDK